ncbi:MAG: hypothetical protein ABI689_08840 [Thermoanaerobaculia bacterium]
MPGPERNLAADRRALAQLHGPHALALGGAEGQAGIEPRGRPNDPASRRTPT